MSRRDLRSRLPKEELTRLYNIERCSLEDIAKKYNVSRTAIMKYCNILGVKRRSRGEARTLAQKRGKIANQPYYGINETFFSSWSPKMAYILGLLVTDGCLSRTQKGSYRISLCLNDKELLVKVTKVMESEHNITESRHQKDFYIFIFGRERIVQDLIRLGMKPRKSLNLEFPNVPKQYLRDFIRGVFDGDGNVFYEKRSTTKKLRTSFTNASKDFICGLEKALHNLGMSKRNFYKRYRKNITYTIKYSHAENIKLFKIMYGGFDYQTKEIAEYLGVSTRTIQRWMKGKTAPSDDEMEKIKAYLTAKKASCKANNRQVKTFFYL